MVVTPEELEWPGNIYVPAGTQRDTPEVQKDTAVKLGAPVLVLPDRFGGRSRGKRRLGGALRLDYQRRSGDWSLRTSYGIERAK